MTQQKPAMKLATMLGTAAFFIGMALAVIMGLVDPGNGTVVLILVIGGIIVGLFNITTKEMVPFLVAAVALVVAGTGGFDALNDIGGSLGDRIDGIVGYIANFMVPAAVINAVKMVWQVARPG